MAISSKDFAKEIAEVWRKSMSTPGYAGLDASYATAMANARQDYQNAYNNGFAAEVAALAEKELEKEMQWAKMRLGKK